MEIGTESERNVYAKWGNNCHCYSSVVHLELSALSSFITGNCAIEKLFIIIIIIIIKDQSRKITSPTLAREHSITMLISINVGFTEVVPTAGGERAEGACI